MKHVFWEKLNTPFFILAPMADVTDWPFRQIVASCGRPDVFYTEFVSADGLASEKGKPKLLPLLHFTKDERPIVGQIFGARPENIFKTAQLIHELGFDGLDINMGCPDRKVMKQGAGIALCKTPELAKEIISAAKEGFDGPISIKTRLGHSEIDVKWIETLSKSNISALVVHLRTAKELSKVPAHWEIANKISEITHSNGVLAICNGDIMSHQEGTEKAGQYNLDGIMIGRGIFHNPYIFRDSPSNHAISKEQGLELLKRHTELFLEFWSRPPFSQERLGRNFNTLKKFFKIYCSGFDDAVELRSKLMSAKNPRDILELIDR